jgi:hypothetical protein
MATVDNDNDVNVDSATGNEVNDDDNGALAGKVADMSATCRPDSQKSALLADSA